MFKYLISVAIEAIVPKADLAAALQRCYDNGAAGFFKIVDAGSGSYVALFERDNDEVTLECVHAHMQENRDLTATEAAQLQLALELGESGETLVEPIVDVLKAFEGEYIDFGSDCLAFAVGNDGELSANLDQPLARDWEAHGYGQMAALEGWNLWQADGSVDGVLQVQKNDSQDDENEAVLATDDDAMRIVANGAGPHHVAALNLLRIFNEAEFKRVLSSRTPA